MLDDDTLNKESEDYKLFKEAFSASRLCILNVKRVVT